MIVATIEGFITDNDLCKVWLQIIGWHEPLEMAIDTGFNSYLWLPRRVVLTVGRAVAWESDEVLLATRYSPISKPVGTVSISWFGMTREVPTFFSNEGEADEQLIGARLLSDCLFLANFPRRRLYIRR